MEEKEKKRPEGKGPGKRPAPDARMDIVRVKRTGLDGRKKLVVALTKIRGVGYNFAKAVVRAAGIDENKKVGELSEAEIGRMEKVMDRPVEAGVPGWMVNRQRDYKTGENVHFTADDLVMALRDSINRLKKIRAYRGIRHELGLPMRGQRTRSSFRRGATLGVRRKKE